MEGLKIRGGRFWEENFGVGGEGWEGVSAFFSVLWISLGGALGGGILHRLSQREGKGGGRGGKKGGRLERKGYRVGGQKKKTE